MTVPRRARAALLAIVCAAALLRRSAHASRPAPRRIVWTLDGLDYGSAAHRGRASRLAARRRHDRRHARSSSTARATADRRRQPDRRARAVHHRGDCSRPAADGAEEQRFLHIQESGSEESRAASSCGCCRTAAGPRYLSASRRVGADAARSRAARIRRGRWHAAALVYDGRDDDALRRRRARGDGRGRVPAARRRADVDRRAAEPRVVLQGHDRARSA